MSILEIPYEKQLLILETRLKGYEANHKFAIKNNNPVRETKYANSIRETKLEITNLERDRPLESNERLRVIIKGLNDEIKSLKDENKEQNKEIESMKARIEAFINPPKVIPPEETDLKINVPHECPACGRTFKGSRGVKVHQSSGACKAAH